MITNFTRYQVPGTRYLIAAPPGAVSRALRRERFALSASQPFAPWTGSCSRCTATVSNVYEVPYTGNTRTNTHPRTKLLFLLNIITINTW